MDKRLLNFLEAIKTHSSITKAAQSLFISQPYMSRVIKKAENSYHVTLLDRSHHQVQLTYAGERLLSYLKNVQNMQQNITTELRQLGQSKFSTIKLGITPPLADLWFSRMLPSLYHAFPNIRTKIFEISTSDAERLLDNHELDLFIGKTIHKSGVNSLSLMTVELALLIPQTAKFYQPGIFWRPFSRSILTQMNNQPFIRTTGEYRFQEMVDHYFSEKGVYIVPQIEVKDSIFAKHLAFEGLGSTILATDMLLKESKQPGKYNVNAVKLPISQLSIDFSVSYHHTPVLSEPIEFLVQQAKQDFTATTFKNFFSC